MIDLFEAISTEGEEKAIVKFSGLLGHHCVTFPENSVPFIQFISDLQNEWLAKRITEVSGVLAVPRGKYVLLLGFKVEELNNQF